jgi:hypothetical protein
MVGARVELELLVKALLGGIGRDIAEQHVGRRFGDKIGAEIGRRARLVLDHDRFFWTEASGWFLRWR